MSETERKKVTLKTLQAMKEAGEPFTMVNAYDYSSIKLVEEAGIDVVVPADAPLATTVLGMPGPAQVTMEHVAFYLQAVVRLSKYAMIVAPMPLGSYEVSNEHAIRNAVRLMKVGAESLVLQGGGPVIERIRALTEVGIPCVGYLGYTPQREKTLGPERVVGSVAEEAQGIYRDAMALSEAGAWGVILQNVPEKVAEVVTDNSGPITIGTGGTRGCDGQFGLFHDLIGWPQTRIPLFSVQYGDFARRAVAAFNKHCQEVQDLAFPTEKHTFAIKDEAYDEFLQQIEGT